MAGSRTLTAEVLAAILGASITLAYLVEIELADGAYARAWSGLGPITFDGKVFTGIGNLGGIGPIQEDQDLRANQVTFYLDGIETALVSATLQSIRPRLSARVWLALFDDAGAIIPDPILLWRGFTDVPELTFGPETSRIQLVTESRLIELEKSRGGRYTDADQQRRWPGDMGFAFVPSIQEKPVVTG